VYDIRLMWTNPKMDNIARPDDFCIRLSPCVCCGYADVGDIQAPDLTPPPGPASVTTVRRRAMGRPRHVRVPGMHVTRGTNASHDTNR
jgi:hypothetical protein